MRLTTLAIFLLFSLGSPTPVETDLGSICIAPNPEMTPQTVPDGTPGVWCDSKKLSVKIDNRKVIPWPTKESLKVDGFDVNARHRVVVLCGGKPRESFSFSYSNFKTKKLCLFINDLYRTVQLWDSKQAPWCKCSSGAT